MADEILWRGRIAPATLTRDLNPKQRTALRRATRFVASESLRIIGHDLADPPKRWLIHERWKPGGVCPRDRTLLQRAAIGGRTTAWCPRCQPSGRPG
ncbi:MAG: zinc finger domain-containing protein [Chthoniobacterales bacterium]